MMMHRLAQPHKSLIPVEIFFAVRLCHNPSRLVRLLASQQIQQISSDIRAFFVRQPLGKAGCRPAVETMQCISFTALKYRVFTHRHMPTPTHSCPPTHPPTHPRMQVKVHGGSGAFCGFDAWAGHGLGACASGVSSRFSARAWVYDEAQF